MPDTTLELEKHKVIGWVVCLRDKLMSELENFFAENKMTPSSLGGDLPELRRRVEEMFDRLFKQLIEA
jgi:hypothetical protein